MSVRFDVAARESSCDKVVCKFRGSCTWCGGVTMRGRWGRGHQGKIRHKSPCGWAMNWRLLPHANEVWGQGNNFTGVCMSTGGSPWQRSPWTETPHGRRPPRQRPPRQSRPGQRQPGQRHPGKRPPESDPPWTGTPLCMVKSHRYASYWKAFLCFVINLLSFVLHQSFKNYYSSKQTRMHLSRMRTDCCSGCH